MRHPHRRHARAAVATATPSLLLAAIAFGGLLLLASVAWGQGTTAPNGLAAPPATSGTAGSAAAKSSGVIQPPMQMDPGIKKPAPTAQAFPTPIVPPPGSPGGKPDVVAK